MTEGIKKMSRQHVHLSADAQTARKVGNRRGVGYVFRVDTRKMHEDGFLFYLSENKVWLTDRVPPEYLKLEPAMSPI
ncbi:MAG: RNA 2'-phosphotransferase [Bacteroidota bacterium]